jgi:GT2 family glycosyltransferase
MLKEIGLFDEDFFAYYEDVDLSFRAQLAGWKVAYEPKAIVYHATGSTSNRIPGFTTYQTLKNLPWVYWKNVPSPLFYKMFPRIFIAYWSFFFSALARGAVMPALKGAFMAHMLMPKKLFQRIKIQRNRKVSVAYIDSMLVHDLPPNAHRLRKLRAVYWKLRGKHS